MKRGKGKGGSGGRSGGGIPERDLNGDTSGGDSGKKKDWRVNKKDVQFKCAECNQWGNHTTTAEIQQWMKSIIAKMEY